ncbi:dehydrodolichyl diphosphate synthase complex subunit Rer2p [[Candida] railenensis]|uniref:Alkyl transferase n=1 Tax=[Candida] railenensis TaxID=45579 RepID=A0A9P0VXU7_9ASCO|nr:dehydrodolichyl diphosphate synthase complex subunit Rer2p [[Candida] railenensis]
MSDWVSTFPGYTQVLTTIKKCFGGIVRTGPTPRHVGIIMDGNRRYAKSHKIEIKEGHNMGFESMANILELLYEAGVEHVTVYAFSIENFKRSKYEVEWLMDLAKSKLQQICQHGDLCEQYGIRIKILGNTKLLPQDVRTILRETEAMTENNTRAVLNVCFPYTSRDEMTHAVQSVVAESVARPTLEINEELVTDNLYTKDSPPLDILVRTSGTYRLSDFLLWQCVPSTCSVVFVEKLWPDFRAWDMCKVLLNWGFNMYWYGHGNGLYTGYNTGGPGSRNHTGSGTQESRRSSVATIDERGHSTAFDVIGSNPSKRATGYDRYSIQENEEDNEDDEEEDDDYDDDDDNDDKEGQADELDTVTSADE